MAPQVRVDGDERVIILFREDTGDIIGSAYAIDDEPGWWRGLGLDGRLRRLWVEPNVEQPHLDVARRLTT